MIIEPPEIRKTVTSWGSSSRSFGGDRPVPIDRFASGCGHLARRSVALRELYQLLAAPSMQELSANLQERTKDFAKRLVDCVEIGPFTKVSVVGDVDDDESEIIIHDFENRRQINLTIKENDASAWLKSGSGELSLNAITIESIQAIAGWMNFPV